MIIAGHQRLKAAGDAGLDKVPVIFLDFDDTTARAYNIADNRLNEESEWDFTPLADMLQELDNGSFDLELTGFDLDEIEKLMNWTPEPVKLEEDEVPEPPKDPVTKPGDLWILGKHRLLCGDSTNADHVMRVLCGKHVDQLLTDPPYGVDYGNKNEVLNRLDGGKRIQTPIANDNITNYREFFASFLGVIPYADYNTVYIFMSGQELHSLRLAFDDAGITWSAYLVWVKNNHVLGRKDYNAKHEFVAYGWRGRHKFYGGFSTTVLEYDKPLKNDLHPTMKPVELVARLMRDGSTKDALVYDPFLGSGTTLIAAEQLGRVSCGMEISPAYCDVIIERWENLTGGKARLEK
jgi:DNA modification methylase